MKLSELYIELEEIQRHIDECNGELRQMTCSEVENCKHCETARDLRHLFKRHQYLRNQINEMEDSVHDQ